MWTWNGSRPCSDLASRLLPRAFCLAPSASRLLPRAFCLAPSASRLLPRASQLAVTPNPLPTRARPPHIHVREWSARSKRSVGTQSPHKLGVARLHASDCLFQRSHITEIGAAILVQVVHGPVAVAVDDDVRRVTVLV